ncbi:hypothetical protein E2C01_005792 [Portunus trituberculatus]|uniref:Uncharacterized protein n=1 Tax=Portunus trituberculatus TaxID=210409 RepID=A0A5B7D033_PORTR|nr:hypothetical protein [Portunus trituberculatus]
MRHFDNQKKSGKLHKTRPFNAKYEASERQESQSDTANLGETQETGKIDPVMSPSSTHTVPRNTSYWRHWEHLVMGTGCHGSKEQS